MTAQERQALQDALTRLADGDRAAFDHVFSALWPLLRRYCSRLLGDASAGEDAAQLALEKILSRVGDWTPGRDALSWALGIATWECRTERQRRARRRERAGSEAEQIAAHGQSPEEAALLENLRAAALEAMETLQPADLETLSALLREARPEIGAATFRKRVERALDRLRKNWRELHGTD